MFSATSGLVGVNVWPASPGRAFPCVPVAQARALQGPSAAPERHAVGVGVRVEVAGHHHVARTQPADQPFDQPRGGQGLPLPLELVAQLVGGTVGDEQQGPHGLRVETSPLCLGSP